MSLKKTNYVNQDKDGYKVENQSPLSPAWMLSGKQNEGKVLVGGKNGFVEWSEGGSGGTSNYELLDNKPKINGLELLGNITLNYVKSVLKVNDTLTFKNQSDEVVLEYTPTQITQYIKNASVSGNKLTLTKQDDSIVNYELNQSSIDQMVYTYLEQHFFETLKRYLGSGFVIDNEHQKISVNNLPEPPQPTFTGIFSKDTQANKYRMYDLNTIFAANGTVNYCLLNENSDEPSLPISYPYSIARQVFNEELIINDPLGNFNGTNFLNFLSNCTAYNQSLDFSNCNWTKIGDYFLLNCPNFNSSITFKTGVQYIGSYFMSGCVSFNKPLTNLIAPTLLKVEFNFMMGCTSFNQDLDFSIVSSSCIIHLDNFMYNCKNFSSKQLRLDNKVLNGQNGLFQVYDYDSSDFLKALATNDVNAPSYTVGVHIQSIYSKAQMRNFHYTNPTTGLRYYPFRDANGEIEGETENVYRKLVVNGVE